MKPGLRIALDGEALRRPLSGVGRYVYELARELDGLMPEATFLLYGRLGAERLQLPSPRWQVRQEPASAWRRLPSFAWLRSRGAAMIRHDGADAFWAGRTLHANLGEQIPTLCTVHDLNHRIVPETMERPTRWTHGLWFDADVRSAQLVVANSDGTATRLQQWTGRAADAVVRPGLSPAYLNQDAGRSAGGLAALAALGIRPPYLLTVSTIEPRKNIGPLVDAFLALKRGGRLAQHALVLAGARGWQNRELSRRLIAAQPQGVVMPGYIPDEWMPALYAHADALFMPSLYEGFGMPVLEARACGTPVVIADVPELREAAGPRCRVLAPHDAPDLRQALLEAADGRLPWPEPAGQGADWASAARRMAALIERLCGGRT